MPAEPSGITFDDLATPMSPEYHLRVSLWAPLLFGSCLFRVIALTRANGTHQFRTIDVRVALDGAAL